MDSGDATVADQIVDLGNAELSRELGELEAAQARLDADRFGQCIDCSAGSLEIMSGLAARSSHCIGRPSALSSARRSERASTGVEGSLPSNCAHDAVRRESIMT